MSESDAGSSTGADALANADGNDINDGDGLEIADPNDFFHRRDSDDQLQPVLQKVPGRDQALRVIPPTTGDYEKFNLDDEDALFENDALLAELLNEKLVDLDRVTAEDVRDGMIAFGAQPLVDCIKRAGGQDMQEALEQREVEQMMGMVGEENLDFQKLVEVGEQMQDEE